MAILNVGDGDTKITFDKNNTEERNRACRIVKDMLKRGYAILVQAGEKDGKPIFYRATDFDPETAEYIVAGMPDEALSESIIEVIPSPGKRIKRLPAEKTKAVSVARSAGGMSDRANSIEMENMRRFDKFAPLRGFLKEAAAFKSEWAGIPMPLQGQDLVIEPSYPKAKELTEIYEKEEQKPQDFKIRSRFYSGYLRADVFIFEEADGKITHGVSPAVHSLGCQLQTLGASVAWGIEQEAAALQLLGTLVSHYTFKHYLMTGSFLETSSRSGITYLFRKLRPTVAMSQRGGESKIVAALCMHPIAYYAGSWAGAMCPTDDVIAHLMLMRGDERLFWRRCNQHPAYRPEAGL